MFTLSKQMRVGLVLGLGWVSVLNGETVEEPEAFEELPEFVLREARVASEEPISTFPMPVSALRFEPQVDVQQRNMAEGQGDISIRGGTFEATGFMVGAATLWDPQTGHYFAEIPVSPYFLSRPVVYTGMDNAWRGFNATAGSIQYGLLPIQGNNGVLAGGLGTNSLYYGEAYGAVLAPVKDSGLQVGVDADVAYGQGDGTREFGDFEFARYNARIQVRGARFQTDLLLGYQSKFFGWPQMYVNTINFPETEDLQTNLYLLNHRMTYQDDSDLEFTFYFRRHKDHYVLNRLIPGIFNAQHESRVWSAAWRGYQGLGDAWGIHHSAQFLADEIDSNQLFTTPPFKLPPGGPPGRYGRSYVKFSVVPEYRMEWDAENTLVFQAGGSVDYSNRNASSFSPMGGIAWVQDPAPGQRNRYYVEFAKSTQLPTYTAIGSNPAGGLFRGNPAVGRENSYQFEIGAQFDRESLSLHTALFFRQDRNLTDWVFSPLVPANRVAAPVDVDTLGWEIFARKHWSQLDLLGGFTWLHKSEDYRGFPAQTSFYGGNYAEQRVTLGAVWRLWSEVEIRSDNEFRVQAPDSLRQGTRTPVLSSLGVYYFPKALPGVELSLSVDNIFNQVYQDVPGVPGARRQLTAGFAYRF